MRISFLLARIDKMRTQSIHLQAEVRPIFSTSLNLSQPKLYAESWTSNASEDCSFHPNDSLAVFTRCGIPEDGSLSSIASFIYRAKIICLGPPQKN